MGYAEAPSTSVVMPSTASATYDFYVAGQSGSLMPSAGSVTYDAPALTYGAPAMTYATSATYAAPIAEPQVYSISPERFQLIMAGQPLTSEEIMTMTGAAQAPVVDAVAVEPLASDSTT